MTLHHPGRLTLTAICFGIPILAFALANGLTDTAFWLLKISAPNIWLETVKRSDVAPLAVFDVTQQAVATLIAIAVLEMLSRAQGATLWRMMRFGSFHWSLPLLVALAPFLFAIPNFAARRLFDLPIAADVFGGWWSMMSTLLVIGILGPIIEEGIWRGYATSALNISGASNRSILIFTSLAFAIAHLPSDIGVLRPIALLPAAFALGFMRLRSGGLLWPLLFHVIGNGFLLTGPLAHALYDFVFGL